MANDLDPTAALALEDVGGEFVRGGFAMSLERLRTRRCAGETNAVITLITRKSSWD
ncbi:hypothetical protein [Ilumatobacter sp.]|uniref:hypothetical protein n=1 Tax=Ilumatobacter sp. TaxID=1967498 RepID=UPI003750270F